MLADDARDLAYVAVVAIQTLCLAAHARALGVGFAVEVGRSRHRYPCER